MEKIDTKLEGVYIVKPKVFRDERGFFFESFSKKKFYELGLSCEFVQDNHSKSVKNTIRGLHFQAYPGQIKLVRCTRGIIKDVVVDIRPNSPSFKKYIYVELSETNFLQLYVPVGFAHGFAVLSDYAEVQYKVSNFYNPSLERTIKYNDEELGIDWGITDALISDRDKNAPSLKEYLAEHHDPFI
ncbi:MAG: dTDP-4-dehydrorhamnose 3,5-epimerase [Promethearchaeota archaeon]